MQSVHYKSMTKRSTLEDQMDVEDDRNDRNDEDGGVDQDALAFIRAKKNVVNLHKAKKAERTGKA